MKRNIIIERECVRLDDSPDVSLADFRCEGVSRERDGFHRTPTMVDNIPQLPENKVIEDIGNVG